MVDVGCQASYHLSKHYEKLSVIHKDSFHHYVLSIVKVRGAFLIYLVQTSVQETDVYMFDVKVFNRKPVFISV